MEPETILRDELGKPKQEQLGQTNKTEGRELNGEVERVPKDCGYSNKLAGAPLGPANFGAGGTSDLRLLRRAIRERWPLSDEMRSKLPQWLVEIVGDEELDVRGRVGAAKVMVEMDKLNMTQEERDAGGQRINLDVTSGGKPIGDLRGLSTEELEQRLKALEGGS